MGLASAIFLRGAMGSSTSHSMIIAGGYTLVNQHSNGISPFLTGNTSSIRVHVPASYVRLPECNHARIIS